MVARENRITDAALTGNLMTSVSFYANTTIYIIAGLIAVAGTLDQLISFTQELPFARQTTKAIRETLEHPAQKYALLNTLSGDEFNRGIRAYYFGFAALAWFISPAVLVVLTALILAVLYRREFESQTCRHSPSNYARLRRVLASTDQRGQLVR